MVIKNGMVAFPGKDDFLVRDIRIEQGRIAEIGSDLAGPPASDTLDAKDCWVLPGGVDPHVHFYDPGYTAKEDFAHGTAFAAQGGITTIIDMPSTSRPPVSQREHLETKLAAVSPKAVVDYAFHGGISRQLLDAPGAEERLSSLKGRVTGIKAYATSGTDDTWGALDPWRFEKLLTLCRELDFTVLLHAEDRGYVDNATAASQAQGRKDPLAWYESRPEMAEILSCQTAIRLAEKTGADLHIVHVGTAAAGEMLASTRVTGETCPQYLAFSVEDFQKQGAVLKIAPPIKKAENHPGLWKLLKEGVFAFIASDHAPGTAADKAGEDIWAASAGICGTGLLLPYFFSEGFLKGRVSLSRFLQLMCANAPRRFGLGDRKGSLELGKDADLVIMDSRRDLLVRGADFLSKGKATPFEGQTFRGRIEKTLVRGEVVYHHGKGLQMPRGYGRFLTPAGSLG